MSRLRHRVSETTDAGAGEGNRTLVVSLEGCRSTIELHPRDWVGWTASGGQRRIRTFEGVSQQIYSLPRLATSVSTHKAVINTYSTLTLNRLVIRHVIKL